MPNAFDPLGLFDAAERDAQRMWNALTPKGKFSFLAEGLPQPPPAPGNDDPLGLFAAAERDARRVDSAFRSLAGIPAFSEAPQEKPAMLPMAVRGRERPMLAPAVIGPRARRQAPKELEYFADSQEQLLASTNPYRAQMDAAFRKAIERVRG